MNAKLFIIIILFFMSSAVQGQVTIGSNLPPSKGALLDLKEFKDESTLANSTRGLMLPRVQLTDISSLVDIDGADTSTNPLIYRGLMVYNMNEVQPYICPGM